MDFGFSVNKDLSVPLHEAGCAPCFEYARHVATFAPLGVTLQNLNNYWTKKLDIKTIEDVAYNDGRRRSYVADTKCINSLKATIESLEGQLQAAKADLESARTTIARLEDAAAKPAVPWAAAMAVDPPAPATLQSRLLPADAGLVVPAPPPTMDKGKGKAPVVPNPAALSARIDDAVMEDMSDELSRDMALALQQSWESYAQAVKLGNPSSHLGAPGRASKHPASSSLSGPKRVKGSHAVGPPMPNRLYVNSLPVPRGRGGHPHFMPNSLWGSVAATDIFGKHKGTDKHLTKYPYAKYAPGSEEFMDLYLEAYQLPFDQRSTLQREVVHLGMRKACPPPIGMWAQTNFQKYLKENGPPVESRVRRLTDGAMRSDNLSVWMFLRDCAGGNTKSRQVFIKTALELLSSGEYHKLVDNSQPAGCWSPRPYGREVSPERADRVFAQHLWACGVDEANYASVFRPYAFAVHLHTECPDGGAFEFGYVLMDERREVALAANHPDTGNVSKKRKQQDAVPSTRPEQRRRASPAAVAAPPQLAPAVKLPQLNLASYEHDVLSDDELSTSGSSDEGGPFAVPRPEARPPVDHSTLCEPDEPLDYGGDSPMGPVIH